MAKILISIKPEYVDLILKKLKKYEYRKKAAKKEISSLVVYVTHPIKKVICEITIDGILKMPPSELWNKTHEHSGVSKEFFDSYFINNTLGCAYVLGEITVFPEPRSLNDYKLKYAPQSFVYIDD